MGSFVVLDSKATNESPVIEVDASSQMDVGEVVVSAVVGASVYSGVDPNPTAIISGLASVDQNMISQQITGGLPGVIYLIRFTVLTSQGNTKILIGPLAVLPP